MDFPRLVYRSADVYRRAENQEAFEALRADGWFASVPEALRGEHDRESGVYTASGQTKPRTKRVK